MHVDVLTIRIVTALYVVGGGGMVGGGGGGGEGGGDSEYVFTEKTSAVGGESLDDWVMKLLPSKKIR